LYEISASASGGLGGGRARGKCYSFLNCTEYKDMEGKRREGRTGLRREGD